MTSHFKEVDVSDFGYEFQGAYNYGTQGEAFESMLEPLPDHAKTESPAEEKPAISVEDFLRDKEV